jgi:transposase-like protein
MARRMDADAPHPHCPFCGLPMQFQRKGSKSALDTVLASFDCKWCGVVLSVSPRAEILQLASPALAPG